MKKILITGGAGYIGSKLTNKLLKKNYKIIVYDNLWFGNHLKKQPNLKIIKKDIRNIEKKDLQGIYKIIHLANIANDPGVDLDPTLAWEINCLAVKNLVELAIVCKVKNFIYASSGSVYGVKKERKVTEDLSLVPISTYNKTKMIAERILLSYKDKIKLHIIRPATVCGLSPRMRFDVSVNLLTLHSLKYKKITVLGGNQIRPNIHIDDMVDLYIFFIKKNNIPAGAYNAGFENISINNIAKMIAIHNNSKIIYKKSNDPRSYRQCSDKLLSLGFKPRYSVRDAIKQITLAYQNKEIKEHNNCYTVKWMKKLNLK